MNAVKEYSVPWNVREVRQFLGLSSYYRRFIPLFAKIAQPLHALTRKGVVFQWDAGCQQAFDTLKQRLVEAPVLAYPSFDRDFVLETDASIEGLHGSSVVTATARWTISSSGICKSSTLTI